MRGGNEALAKNVESASNVFHFRTGMNLCYTFCFASLEKINLIGTGVSAALQGGLGVGTLEVKINS